MSLRLVPPREPVIMALDWVDLENNRELLELIRMPKMNEGLLSYLSEAPLQQYPLFFAKEGFCYISREQFVELIGPLTPQESLEAACDDAFGKEGEQATPRQKHNRTLFLTAAPEYERHSCPFSVDQIVSLNKRKERNVLSLDELVTQQTPRSVKQK